MVGTSLKLPPIPDGWAVLGADRRWTWREVHAAAAELAARLPAGTRVCNLCATRVGFLVTWLAALRRGCLQLLPPSGGRADLVSLLDGEQDVTVLVDDETLLRPVARTRARGIVYLPRAPRDLPSDAALAWTPDFERVAFCLYTSGSTGQPQPQWRTLGQMVRGAQALATRLDPVVEGGLGALRAIVSSVPPQHMFGFETSVLLPWVTGIPVLDRRPLLPLDVRAALEQAGGPAAWIATPLHLRALEQAGETLPHCRLALVSTMPLAQVLAQRVESLAAAPVIEIFGSTETGALATRRTGAERAWLPLAGVRVEQEPTATLATGDHFPSPQHLTDLIEVGADGRFEVLGRHADMVKIGGRRASLANLNLLLQDLPGLQDGVFHLPAGGSDPQRLVLLHAGSLDRAAAEAWLRERIDPVFMPRRWLRVERLPRDANGKLPRAALEALFEAHRTAPAAEASLNFQFTIPAAHRALPGHFPGRPIVPGVLLLDVVAQHVRSRTGRDVVHLPRVKFLSALGPGEAAGVRFEQRGTALSFRISTVQGDAPRLVAEGRMALGPVCAEAAA